MQQGYLGISKAIDDYHREKLLPALLVPAIPTAIGAASSYADAKLEAGDYETARTQPRDYMFQPVIEGY